MSKAADPYYNRKSVPDEFIQDVGLSGLSKEEEYSNREKKFFSGKGSDVRNFFNPKGANKGAYDPYYQRKQVPDSFIEGVGVTGLTAEEEFLNRERKYSLGGGDLRNFTNSSDPYYTKRMVDKSSIVGVGELDLTPAQAYEKRDRKLSTVQFSDDPFQLLTGSGHRKSSVAGVALDTANQATQRRRSSAAAPHVTGGLPTTHHSGFDGNKLEPIVSRAEAPTSHTIGDQDKITETGPVGSTISGQSSTGSTAVGANNGHATFYDATTVGNSNHNPHAMAHNDSIAPHDMAHDDSIAPHEIR